MPFKLVNGVTEERYTLFTLPFYTVLCYLFEYMANDDLGAELSLIDKLNKVGVQPW